MPYKPTGRPAGRPRTSDLTAISVKLPRDLLFDAAVEARLAQTTVSALLRDGLVWRLQQTALDRTRLRSQCAEIHSILAQEHVAEAQAREAAAHAAAREVQARPVPTREDALAQLAARREREAEEALAQIWALARQIAPVAPTQREVGIVAVIVKDLAPTHPGGVTPADVLAWCEAAKVSWATPALVEEALAILARDFGYVTTDGRTTPPEGA